MRSILVTGAGGFLGRHLVAGLAAAGGWDVRAGLRTAPTDRTGLPAGVTPVVADVRNPAALDAALAGCDAVIHAAVGDWDTTVEGARTLVECARRQGVRRLVAISSIAVHGGAPGRITEDAPLVTGRRDYAGAKAEAERVLNAEGGPPSVVLLRPTIIVGRGSTLWIDRMATRIRSGRWGTFGALGKGTCNVVAVEDVVAAALAALDADLPHGTALTINGPDRPTWNTYFEELAHHLGAGPLRRISPVEARRRSRAALSLKALGRLLPPSRSRLEAMAALAPAGSELRLFALRADYPTDKAEALLNWRPTLGLEETLRRALSPTPSGHPSGHPSGPTGPTGIAFVGCGFVADLYMQTLPAHPELRLIGVYDRDPARMQAFATHHAVPAYDSLDALLADPAVALVVNLTNPASHAAVTRAALEAGRAVYSEKPLATTLEDAHALAALAEERGLGLAAAPCTHLSDAVATLGQALADDRIGRPLLVHAEMDDGMIPTLRPETWRSASGAPWPVEDEFRTGCVMEHAGYQIAPLVRLFGPVRRVTALAGLCLPDKGPAQASDPQGPDLSFGVLEFDGGLTARLTCSILAPMDRSVRVVGERGVLTLSDIWEYDSPVRLATTGAGFGQRVRRRLEKSVIARWIPGAMLGRRLRPVALPGVGRLRGGGHRMDFARGIAALAASLTRAEPDATLRALAVHVTEVTLALQGAPGTPVVHPIRSDVPGLTAPRPAAATSPPGPESGSQPRSGAT